MKLALKIPILLAAIFNIHLSFAGDPVRLKTREKFLYEDGTWEIIEPFLVSNIEGDVAVNGTDSSGTGVCKALGFGTMIGYADASKDIHRGALIDGLGRLFEIRDVKNKKALSRILCAFDAALTLTRTSRNAEAILPDSSDHTVLIKTPAFQGSRGKVFPIAADSSYSGVCRLFGVNSWFFVETSG